MIPPCSVLLCLVLSSALLVRGVPLEVGPAVQMKQNDGQPSPPLTLVCTLATPGDAPGQKRSEEGPVIQMKRIGFQQGTSSSVYTCTPSASSPATAKIPQPGINGTRNRVSRLHSTDNEN